MTGVAWAVFFIMIAPTYATEAQSLAGSVCAFTNSWVNAAGKGSDFELYFYMIHFCAFICH